MKIILASQSKIRTELLSMINIPHEIIVSDADETLDENLCFEEQAKKLSYIKAKKVFDETTGDRIIIGADTMINYNNKIIGKPKDETDAFNMLKMLQGKTHQIVTGLTVLVSNNNEYKEYTTYDVAEMTLKDISDKEIKEWIEKGNVLNKAGSYAIYSEFAKHLSKIEGHFATVQGLPIHKLYDILKEIQEMFNIKEFDKN